MSHRIYLNSGRDETSKFGLNRIDWTEVATRMSSIKEAEDRGEHILRFNGDFIDPGLLRVAQDDSLANDAAQSVQESGGFDHLSPEQADALRGNPHVIDELVNSGIIEEDAAHAFMSPEGEGDLPMDGGGMETSGEPIFASASAKAILERLAKKNGGKAPAHLAKYLFKKKKQDDADTEAPQDDAKEDAKPKDEDADPKKSFKMERKGKDAPVDKKATAKSIKADAIHEAEASGNFERAAQIQAIRSDRRIKLAQALAELEIDRMKRETKGKKQRTVAANTAEAAKTADPYDGFVSPRDMTAQAKLNFARKAEAVGFPPEYVEQMLGLGQERTASNDLVETIKEIGKSSMSKEVISSAVKGLLKVAELGKEDSDRIYSYWVDELGYDPEWTKALITNYEA